MYGVGIPDANSGAFDVRTACAALDGGETAESSVRAGGGGRALTSRALTVVSSNSV